MRRILGINEGINSALVVLEDGRIRFALQEERVNRIKNYIGFPTEALKFTFHQLGLQAGDFDLVSLANTHSPTLSKKEFLASYDSTADQADRGLIEGEVAGARRLLTGHLPVELKNIKRRFSGNRRNARLQETLAALGFSEAQTRRHDHHKNHAAAAYYGLRKNPKDAHLVLTLDGGGDTSCSHVYLARDGMMELIAATPNGHSIGNIYSRITHLMGMTPHEHEYKLMGLSGYAKRDKYVTPLIEKLRSYISLDPSNPLVFKCHVPELTYAIQPRLAQDFKRARFDNVAAAIQFFTEDLIIEWVRAAIEKTGVRKVVAGGGVFMNVKANKRIAERPEIEYFDVFPSCGDETLCFGSAWSTHAESSPSRGDDISFDSYYLGPDCSYDLPQAKAEYSHVLDFKRLEQPEKTTAELLAKGHIVARCSGPMEFGARALGNRSILADPQNSRVVPEINKMIKQRDFWMPFAPAMTSERARDYIRVPPSLPQRISPYMMHSFDSTDRRSDFTAGIHAYDLTARAQIVVKELNPGFHEVITHFAELTGRAVVLNTSYNLHGSPLVMGAKDAVGVMLNSSLNYMVIEDTLVTKRSSGA
jgi:carbamoyltransferase